MFWTDLITGVILMLTGLMVYKFPMTISGVNTMSNKRLEKVDLEGLKNALCKVLLIGGAVMLLLGVLTTLIHIPMGVHMIALFAVILGIVVASLLISRKYDAGLQGEEGKKERKKNLIGIIIAVVATVGVLFFFFKGSKPATVDVSDEFVTAKGGGYNASIPISDITEATVSTAWPDISIRTNGIATDEVCIGHFRLKNGEKCMLFLCEDGGPVLEVRTTDGGLYYLNCAMEEETLEMIAKIKQRTDLKLSAALRHCEERSNLDKELVSWIASSCLLAMTSVKTKGR